VLGIELRAAAPAPPTDLVRARGRRHDATCRGTGGFKATPGSGWVFAHTIAQDRPHPLNEPFALERFETGRLIDEHGAAGVAH